MKTLRIALLGSLIALPALAQLPPYAGTHVAPGQTGTPGTGVNVASFAANTDPVGFSEQSVSTALVAAGTTLATATQLTARVNYIGAGACASGAFVLPAVQRYTLVTVINRSGAACTLYPTAGATVESAPGTAAAAGASITVASNADVTFRPVLLPGASQVSWLQ